MEVDARTLDIAGLDADVCVIGAGPAGLTIARTLAARRSVRIVVLESGGRSSEPDAQVLCDGTAIGDPYAGPGTTRRRQVGGTATMWNTWFGHEPGGKYVPLDAVDFEARPWWPLSGWPFDKASMDPYYERAQSLCGLGPCAYQGADWASPDCSLLPLSPGPLTTDVYQFGPARLFTDTHVREIQQAHNVLLCLHATAVRLATDDAGRSVTRVDTARVSGRPLPVRANLYVLAAGGIENARLLLLAGGAGRQGLGNQSNLVGRCFMEHPRDFSGRLVPADRRLLGRCGLYDFHRAAAGVAMGRLAFTNEARRREQLPGMSVTLLLRPRAFRWWTRHRSNAVELVINIEQAPDPENRIALGIDRDRFDMPKPEIHWRWRELDRQSLARIRGIVTSEIERSGIGRVTFDPDAPPDPNAHHHMGTTRMHRDPQRGVVTEDGRVHGVANLYVAGSSVFPTSGFANPTLTIVALALRLAEHLEGRLASSG
jgi:choline dehydrogenase-like flavoprotein